jgi:hypothetical protein
MMEGEKGGEGLQRRYIRWSEGATVRWSESTPFSHEQKKSPELIPGTFNNLVVY